MPKNAPDSGLCRATDVRGRVLLSHVVRPTGFLMRLRGLIGRPELKTHEGWWFERCSAVHTLGMSRPIDVVHLSASGEILRIRRRLAPGRFSACRQGRQVLELAAGAAASLGLRAGQKLVLVP